MINEQWDSIPKEELVKKMLSYEFNRFFDYYRKAKDINIQEKPKKDTDSRKKGERKERKLSRSEKDSKNFVLEECEKGFKWVKINLGYKHNISPRTIVDIARECGANKSDVGRIEITNDCLYVAIKKDLAKKIASQIDGGTLHKYKLTAEVLK